MLTPERLAQIAEEQRQTNQRAIALTAKELREGIIPRHVDSAVRASIRTLGDSLERRLKGAEVRPVPLVRDVGAPEEYPIDALGPTLAPAARAIVDAVQVPAALAGNSVLAAAALCAQPHANVETLGGFRPLSLFMLTVAVSGERKTSADFHAVSPIREHSKRLRIKYQAALLEFEANSEAHKARIRKAKDDAQDADALAAALKAIPAVVPPRRPHLLCTEPTAEGLIVSLQDGQLSQGVFSDEAGSFIGGHALKEDAELRSIAMLSRAWDASPLDRVRAKDREHTTLYGRRVSLHLMAQPEVAALMLGKPLYRSQGFLARFLIAQPASLIGTRMHDGREIDISENSAMRAYRTALTSLLERPAHEHPDFGGLEPGSLRLLPEARSLLVDSYNAIEVDQREDGPLSGVRDFASKAAEHACRIAGTLSLATDSGAMYVSVEDMRRALTLVQFYIGEHERLAGTASISIETRNAVRLLDWVKRRQRSAVTASDVMKAGPNCIRESATARAALRMLTENGWLEQDGRAYRPTQGALAEWQRG